ncbi:hypothetical protein BGZ76_004618 [Entomortierella beljakovae]|nr:hypothetical protein BGZ76_004618 [Entomortierella beljakovae]
MQMQMQIFANLRNPNTDEHVMLLRTEISELEKPEAKSIVIPTKEPGVNDELTCKKIELAARKIEIVCTLSKVIRGAKGNDELLKRRVKLQCQEVFREDTQCLSITGDVLPLISDIPCDDGERHGREDGIFLCKKKNMASLDCRWIMKPGDDGKPLAIFIQEWYDYIDSATVGFRETYDVVIVVITNRGYNFPTQPNDIENYGQDSFSDMPRLLLIEKPCIEHFISPTFAYRCIVAMPDDNSPVEIQPSPSD